MKFWLGIFCTAFAACPIAHLSAAPDAEVRKEECENSGGKWNGACDCAGRGQILIVKDGDAGRMNDVASCEACRDTVVRKSEFDKFWGPNPQNPYRCIVIDADGYAEALCERNNAGKWSGSACGCEGPYDLKVNYRQGEKAFSSCMKNLYWSNCIDKHGSWNGESCECNDPEYPKPSKLGNYDICIIDAEAQREARIARSQAVAKEKTCLDSYDEAKAQWIGNECVCGNQDYEAKSIAGRDGYFKCVKKPDGAGDGYCRGTLRLSEPSGPLPPASQESDLRAWVAAQCGAFTGYKVKMTRANSGWILGSPRSCNCETEKELIIDGRIAGSDEIKCLNQSGTSWDKNQSKCNCMDRDYSWDGDVCKKKGNTRPNENFADFSCKPEHFQAIGQVFLKNLGTLDKECADKKQPTAEKLCAERRGGPYKLVDSAIKRTTDLCNVTACCEKIAEQKAGDEPVRAGAIASPPVVASSAVPRNDIIIDSESNVENVVSDGLVRDVAAETPPRIDSGDDAAGKATDGVADKGSDGNRREAVGDEAAAMPESDVLQKNVDPAGYTEVERVDAAETVAEGKGLAVGHGDEDFVGADEGIAPPVPHDPGSEIGEYKGGPAEANGKAINDDASAAPIESAKDREFMKSVDDLIKRFNAKIIELRKSGG